jgi:hypothetical protein
MCFEVGALTPIGLADDTVDVPVGWIHRSVQRFLVADHCALPCRRFSSTMLRTAMSGECRPSERARPA